MQFSAGINKRSVFSRIASELQESGELPIEQAKLELVKIIERTMDQENVTRAELARRLEASRAYVTQLLQGNVNFTVESLVRIASALDSEVEYRFVPKARVNNWLRSDEYYPVRQQKEDKPESLRVDNQSRFAQLAS